jgi:hypothetical protein
MFASGTASRLGASHPSGCIDDHGIGSLRELGWGWAGRTSRGVIRTNNAPKVRFSATLGKEPEIELGLV